jgi:hypothetical protein
MPHKQSGRCVRSVQLLVVPPFLAQCVVAVSSLAAFSQCRATAKSILVCPECQQRRLLTVAWNFMHMWILPCDQMAP